MDSEQNAAANEEGRAGESSYLRGQDLEGIAHKFNVTELRRCVAEEPMLPSSTYAEWENEPFWMVPIAILHAVLQVSVVTAAHFFMIAYGRNITPHCASYHVPGLPELTTDIRKWEEDMCYVSTFCFWTYPVVCPLVVVFVYWKHLEDKRIFYECILNKVFVQFGQHSFLHSPSFWFLMVYGYLAVFCLYFIKDSVAKGASYTQLFFSLLAYFTPIGAFLVFLFSTWSVNWHIITLPKFVEEDRLGAVKLLEECAYVKHHDFGNAFEAVESLYDKLKALRKPMPVLTTSELVKLTLEMHQKGIQGTERAGRNACDCFSCLCLWWWFSRKYWATRFLYFQHLEDSRSAEFRRWCRLYVAFICFAVIIFVWAFLYTFLSFTIFEGGLMPEGVGPHEVLPDAAEKAEDEVLSAIIMHRHALAMQ
eukprot:gnl/TRDRNA2_/TRDRNA2_175887_c0_seq1.p1 gnl/TRDRNA2_/TRDRNA2_175887_c0~~gnl/TRDRNA2_/TRDRNA2_175887_c0_seq1.p1  ORF type:complete len:421 (-),score=53.40 gnl/TRDRNA2_/TRDRNA2_175887_c0_seq1:61-1323(-)